jgi:hypothetical protein
MNVIHEVELRTLALFGTTEIIAPSPLVASTIRRPGRRCNRRLVRLAILSDKNVLHIVDQIAEPDYCDFPDRGTQSARRDEETVHAPDVATHKSKSGPYQKCEDG